MRAKKEMISLVIASLPVLAIFGTAKLLTIGDSKAEMPIVETALRGCFSTHDKAEGVIIGEDEIYYVKVWRDGEVFEFHGLNLKNMNVLPKSDGNKIRFSGKYLDLDEKGCAVPTTSPQQAGPCPATARLNITSN